VHYRDNWYLDAYCHLREDLRSFAVDAIQSAIPRETRAKEIPKAELDEYLGSGYGIFAGRKVVWATLKFSPKMARWVSAQTWHPDQRHSIEKDGSYLLELPYADDRELVMEILKFGPDVEVLSPAPLRKRVSEWPPADTTEAHAVSHRYSHTGAHRLRGELQWVKQSKSAIPSPE
jgi:predicted DNA-binding transcriptional regulator YafY